VEKIYAGGPLQRISAKTLVDDQQGLRFVQCPRWNSQKLVFLDVHDKCIKSTDMQGNVRTESTLPYLPGSLDVYPSGGLLVADAWHHIVHQTSGTGREQRIDLRSVAVSCLNHSVVESHGGVYLCDVGFDYLNPLVDPVPNGIIVFVDHRSRTSVVANGLLFPGGMVITPDGQTLIVAEMLGHRLTAFDIASDGSLRNCRLWAQLPGNVSPHGICLDEQGAVWLAAGIPRALRVLEGGEVVNEVLVERNVFDVALGGPLLKHLFLCTSVSADPIITRREPDATIDIAEVGVSGQ
jgi:sugar lactone lactonase YvrE